MKDKKSAASALEKELKIVRKFLKRNNLEALVNMISAADDIAHGVKVTRGSAQVVSNVDTAVEFRNVYWDSDGYFETEAPTRLTVPTGLGGRYLLHVALRWQHDDGPLTPPNDTKSYFHAFITLNGNNDGFDNDVRSSANKVIGGAVATSQHFMAETQLNAGDFVELWLAQQFGVDKRCDAYFTIRRVGT